MYQSFNTTRGKLDKTLNGLKEVQRNINQLPSLNIDFKSENFFSQSLVIPILKDYEADTFVDTNTHYLEIVFNNADENIISTIDIFPIFYGITANEIANFDISFEKLWEKIDNNIRLSLSIFINLRDNEGNIPGFVNLYLLIKNNRLFYNV